MNSFYAEELGNINALRVTICVDAKYNVAEDLQVVNNTLVLDNKVLADLSQVGISVHTQDLVITQPQSGGDTWEIKLNLAKSPQKLRSQQVEVQEWWSSKILKDNKFKGLLCNHCHQELISSVDYKIKDLPSEHWYELVECWICHEEKPEEHRERLRPILAKQDLLLVGTTYFLLHPKNLIAGTIKEDPIVTGRVNWNRGTMTKWIAINCSQCHQPLGEGNYEMQDNTMQLLAFKLFKYCVEVKPHLIEQPVFTDFFVCDLINAAKIHATHRFLIQGRQSERIYSLLWLFNWDTNIVYNSADKLKRERVIKVMYLDCFNQDNEHTKKYLEMWSRDKTTDHLIYPDNVCEQLVNTLSQSTLLLPSFMRVMNHPAMIFTQNFSIGFIHRSDD